MTQSKRSYQDLVAIRKVSKHVVRRIRQRGFCEGDLELICDTGEEFAEGYLMSSRAVSEKICRLKAEIQRLERLKDVVLIEQEDTFITVYRANSKRCKRILKYGISQIQ